MKPFILLTLIAITSAPAHALTIACRGYMDEVVKNSYSMDRTEVSKTPVSIKPGEMILLAEGKDYVVRAYTIQSILTIGLYKIDGQQPILQSTGSLSRVRLEGKFSINGVQTTIPDVDVGCSVQ